MHSTTYGSAEVLLALGSIMLLGLLCDFLGKRTQLPRITLLMVSGLLIGQQGLDLIPDSLTKQFPLVSDFALLMIGFLLGGQFHLRKMRRNTHELLFISTSAALVTSVLVAAGLHLLGLPLSIAILLGCIASATAPAAVVDVVVESGSKSPFSKLLLTIVAVDDLWALVIFSLGMALANFLISADAVGTSLMLAGYEIVGAVILGLCIGYPAAHLTGRIQPGQPTLVEALGLVLCTGGLAKLLEVSFLLSAMVMGAMITNFARHHEYPFHELDNLEWPFMLIFFVLAGATLEVDSLASIGMVGAGYIVLRSLGKCLGAYLGAELSGSDRHTKRWMGLALLPQAGVAIGMALIAANQFPEYGQLILSVVISATVVFELAGPPLTRLALLRSHTTQPQQSEETS